MIILISIILMPNIIEIIETTDNYNTIIYDYYYEELKQYNVDMNIWSHELEGNIEIIYYIMDNIIDKLDQKTIDIILLTLFAQTDDININIIKKLIETYNGNIYAKIKIDDKICSCFNYVEWADFGSSYMDFLLDKYEKDNIIPPITDNTLYQIMSVWGYMDLFVRALKLCRKYKIKIHTYEHIIYNIFHRYNFEYIMPLIHHTKREKIFTIPEYIDSDQWITSGMTHPFDAHLWYRTASNLEQLGLVVIHKRIIL